MADKRYPTRMHEILMEEKEMTPEERLLRALLTKSEQGEHHRQGPEPGGEGDMSVQKLSETLRPCPFCGYDKPMFDTYDTKTGRRVRVVCPECMGMVDNGWSQSKYIVLELWNRRTQIKEAKEEQT